MIDEFIRLHEIQYYEGSAKSGKNVNEVFFELSFDIIKKKSLIIETTGIRLNKRR